MAFNPPSGVADGATYGYGNMVWEYAAGNGVWNIVGGTIIGGIGPTGADGLPGAASVPLATTSLTGVASFRPTDFVVSVTGNVSLTNDVARKSSANTFQSKNVFLNGLDSVTVSTKSIYPYGEASYEVGSIEMTSTDGGGIQINSKSIVLGVELKNGYSPTFIDLNNDVAGPSIEIGASTGNSLGRAQLYPTGLVLGGAAGGYTTPLMVTGGVFRNPSEFAPHFTTTSNNLVVNGISGSIQRFTITPTGKVTVSMGTGWHSLTAATETIALIIQNNTGFTGVFDGSILTEGSPIFFGQDTTTPVGSPGAITALTLMRVNKGNGTYLNMGFVIATGMTAANILIN